MDWLYDYYGGKSVVATSESLFQSKYIQKNA